MLSRFHSTTAQFHCCRHEPENVNPVSAAALKAAIADGWKIVTLQIAMRTQF